jgi:hypothetical protein
MRPGLAQIGGKRCRFFLQNVNSNGSRFPQIGIDQTDLGRIADQVNGGLQVQLVHDVGPVVLHRFGADAQFVGDFSDVKPFGQQPQNFLLTRSQGVIVRITDSGVLCK